LPINTYGNESIEVVGLTFETAAQIAERTGRPLQGLDDMLTSMWRDRGQLFAIDFGGTRVYKMLPWVFGIYEFQVKRMDRELAELNERYYPVFGKQFFRNRPQYSRVIPIESEIPARNEALPFDRVSQFIENAQSFGLETCICKKEMRLMDRGCDKPEEVCLGLAPIPGVFENSHWGRPISREEAYEVLEKAEEAALVHMCANVESGQIYICNCCGCCCGLLRSITQLGITDAINSNYYAVIDADECTGCGVCAEERCQVNAIEEEGDVFRVIRDRCIGCGLCITECPTESIRLVSKTADEMEPPPRDDDDWFDQRASVRGIDYTRYK
jgi:NAD-dependent dihydropyrimidine dehydrogenase PreA subunit